MIPNNFVTRWASVGSAMLVGVHYGAVGVFKAEDMALEAFKHTKAAIVHDIASANGYAPMIGTYLVDESKASRADIEGWIDESAARHYKRSKLTLTQFKKLSRSVVLNESAHSSEALSLAGAIGVGQIMPFNVKICGLDNAKQLVDAESNIDCHAQILAALLDRTNGNIEQALSLYNWGKIAGGKNGPLPAETRKYIAAVISDYKTS
jgi:soluble lytic murein transglycosylase-like protein